VVELSQQAQLQLERLLALGLGLQMLFGEGLDCVLLPGRLALAKVDPGEGALA